jgi:hypothetical protein
VRLKKYTLFLTMLHYPVKILMAFGETFTEKNGAFLKWLMNNNYPELAALSSAIRGSYEARDWLLKNKFPELAALDSAIDEQQEAFVWLKNHEFNFLIVLAEAINGKKEAFLWLEKNQLDIFLQLVQKIKNFRDNQTYDYHKLHF